MPIAACVEIVPAELRFARFIARVEGWDDPSSPVRRLHNPGALIFAGQLAARRGLGGLARFRTDADGWRALLRDHAAKREIGFTEAEIIRRWSERPEAYLKFWRLLQ